MDSGVAIGLPFERECCGWTEAPAWGGRLAAGCPPVPGGGREETGPSSCSPWQLRASCMYHLSRRRWRQGSEVEGGQAAAEAPGD